VKQSATGVTPLVLDLTDTGIDTTTAKDGVQFDIDGDGKVDHTAWVKGGNGLLVADINHDGQINDGRELFGSGTVLKNGERAKDGFQALADLDDNHDGVLDAKDASFELLQVWVDANSNAHTDAGELRSLSEVGVTSIDLHAKAFNGTQNGNAQGLVSSFTTQDGQAHQVVDVWLTNEPVAASRETALNWLQELRASSGSATTGTGYIDLSTDSAGNAIKLGPQVVSELSVENVFNSSTTTLVSGLGLGETAARKQLMITGNDNDTADVGLSNWTQTDTVVSQNSHTYAVFNSTTTSDQLLIDQAMLNAHHVM
jgi:hypothetical protein